MKKKVIKPYLYELIKENVLYIVFSFGFLILIIFLIQTSVTKIITLDQKYQTTKIEVDKLRKKFNTLNTNIPQTEELEQDIKILNTLIPNAEDYFSIIYTIDKLSRDTGFIIDSYSVNMRDSTANELRLTIGGVGDTTQFMNFLSNYNFSGGRLITSDKIVLKPNSSGQINVDLTFYNKKINLDYNQDISDMSIDQKVFKDVAALKSKISFIFDESSSGSAELDTSYPTKSNPF